jgi:nicotinate phosphoribosyltransferase
MEEGRRARPAPPLATIADHAASRLERLPEGCRRLLNPHVYHVSITQALHEERERLMERAGGGA